MVRGTTPKHTFTLPFLASNLTKYWITYAQDGDIVLDLTDETTGITRSGYTLSYTLTQAETLRFKTNVPVEIQITAMTSAGVMRSEIISIDVDRILKGEEITST